MEILPKPSFARLTTLDLGGYAEALIILNHLSDVEHLGPLLQRYQLPPLVVGRGSNILANDGYLPLLLIKPNFYGHPQIIAEDELKAVVEVEAGHLLPKFLNFCAKHGLSGLEGLAGIPGTVGGAIAMNAGSYGTQICEDLSWVKIWQDDSINTLNFHDINYGYRHFSFDGSQKFYIILAAAFTLRKDSPVAILSRMQTNLRTKKQSQPIQAKSAGCVFKNPVKAPAAWRLLEMAGFRGKILGGVAFSQQHANFLINRARGTSVQAQELIYEAREAVLAQTKIALEPEIRIIACPRL